MSREPHAGICERRGVRFPPATQLGYRDRERTFADLGLPSQGGAAVIETPVRAKSERCAGRAAQ